MAVYNKITSGQIFMGKADHGGDLLEQLTAVCRENGVTCGEVSAIGAISSARFGYYNQDTREYAFTKMDGHFEIVSLNGNISLKDGVPFVHAHIIFSDQNGQCYGGHLTDGCKVFACEFTIHAYDGAEFSRVFDEATGLGLWKLP